LTPPPKRERKRKGREETVVPAEVRIEELETAHPVTTDAWILDSGFRCAK